MQTCRKVLLELFIITIYLPVLVVSVAATAGATWTDPVLYVPGLATFIVFLLLLELDEPGTLRLWWRKVRLVHWNFLFCR